MRKKTKIKKEVLRALLVRLFEITDDEQGAQQEWLDGFIEDIAGLRLIIRKKKQSADILDMSKVKK